MKCRVEFICHRSVEGEGRDGDTNIIYLHTNDVDQAYGLAEAIKPDNWHVFSCGEVNGEVSHYANDRGFW